MATQRFFGGFFSVLIILASITPALALSALTAEAAIVLPDACTETGELILNGSFEATDDRVGIVRSEALNGLSTWDIFPELPDVTDGSGVSWYADDGKDGIEVDYIGTVTTPHDGVHHIELDSHATGGLGTNSVVSQDVSVEGGTYELSYWYKPRTGTTDDNIVELAVDGAIVHTANETSSTQSDWEQVLVQVDLKPGDHTVSLRGAGTENSLGGLADSVSLTCADPAPAACTYNDAMRIDLRWGDVADVINSAPIVTAFDGNVVIADGVMELFDTTKFNPGDSIDIDEAGEIAWTSNITTGNDGIIFDAYSNTGADAEITVETLEFGPLTYTFDEIRAGVDVPVGQYSLSITEVDEITGSAICADTGTITVYKDVITDDGGSFVEADFAPTIDGKDYVWGETVKLDPGTYSISEIELTTITEAYDMSFSGDCASDGSITLAAGEDLTCTIINDDDLPLPACDYNDGVYVEMRWGDVDDVLGNVGSTYFDGSVTIEDGLLDLIETVKWDSRDSILTDSMYKIEYISRIVSAYDGLNFKAYSYAGEDAEVVLDSLEYGPLAYTFDELRTGVAIGASPYVVRLTATDLNNVDICAGPDMGADDATLTIVKEIDPSSTAVVTADDFDLFAGSTEFENGVSQVVTAGTYTISESTNVSYPYTATFSGACDATDEVVIAGGEDLTCTISNLVIDDTKSGPTGPDPGTLTLYLEIINDDGGTFTEDQFELYANDILFESGVPQDIDPGTYRIDEEYAVIGIAAAIPDLYTVGFSGAGCDSSGLVTMTTGADLSCTVTIDDVADTSSSGGGGGSGGSSGGGGGSGGSRGGGSSTPTVAPTPQVLGVTDEVPTEDPVEETEEETPAEESAPADNAMPEETPEPEPQVLGVTDELPRTGTPAGMLLLAPAALFLLMRRKED